MTHPTPRLRFDDRVVLVTGAGRGVGRAHAQAFAEHGAAVVLADLASRDDRPSAASVAAGELRAAGLSAVAVDCDVTDPRAATRAVEAAVAEFGQLDAVVNNAGTIAFDAFPEDMDRDALQSQLDVHVYGALNIIQAAWGELRRNGRGRVLNTASAALLGSPGTLSYGVAKMAVLGLSNALATRGAEHGIRVNTLLPSAETDMQAVADTAGKTNDSGLASARQSAASSPEQCTPMALVLCHDECPSNGGAFFNGRGTATQFQVVTTRGWTTNHMTAESLLANWDRVCDPDQSWAPGDAFAFRAHFLSRVPDEVVSA